MNKYYLAFKLNPLDAMSGYFPGAHTHHPGILCTNMSEVIDYLKSAKPNEHHQDATMLRLGLPAVDVIMAATQSNGLHKITPGEFKDCSYPLKSLNVTQIHISINEDIVHDQNPIGTTQNTDLSQGNALLRSCTYEMWNRMGDLQECFKAFDRHPKIPKDMMATWGCLMFKQGIHSHESLSQYFDEFAYQYTAQAKICNSLGPDFGPEAVLVLAIDAASTALASSPEFEEDEYAFEQIQQNNENELQPIIYQRMLLRLQPDAYLDTLLQYIPQQEQEAFKTEFKKTIDDLRISNQVELRNGNILLQNITLQAAQQVCKERAFESFKSQNFDLQHKYESIHSMVTADEARFDNLNERDLDEQSIDD